MSPSMRRRVSHQKTNKRGVAPRMFEAKLAGS
jgi:hypothetical protein